jgi:hypothetical protein
MKTFKTTMDLSEVNPEDIMRFKDCLNDKESITERTITKDYHYLTLKLYIGEIGITAYSSDYQEPLLKGESNE